MVLEIDFAEDPTGPTTKLIMAISDAICRSVVIWVMLGVCLGSSATAQLERYGSSVLEPVPASQSPPVLAVDAGQSLDRLITQLVLKNIPHDFSDSKNWGNQAERWSGVKFRREGLKIETKRRTKKVNDGVWKKYAVQLRNPEEEFSVQVKNMRETADGKFAVDVHFLAHLDVQARQAKWVKGVQLYSLSAQGHAKVRMITSLELEIKMGQIKLPPDLVFVPRVTNADLVVDEFRIDRISKVGGEVAQRVGKSVRSKLDEQILKKKEKLIAKINGQLEKNQDKFTLSIADAIKSKWTQSAKPFLPEPVQQALSQ